MTTCKQIFDYLQESPKSIEHEELMTPIDELSFEKWPEGDHRRGSMAWDSTMYQLVKGDPDRYVGGEHTSLLGIATEDYYRADQLI